MQKNLDDEETQTEILALLRNVAHSDEGTSALLTEGGVLHVKVIRSQRPCPNSPKGRGSDRQGADSFLGQATMHHHASNAAVQTEGLAKLKSHRAVPHC